MNGPGKRTSYSRAVGPGFLSREAPRACYMTKTNQNWYVLETVSHENINRPIKVR